MASRLIWLLVVAAAFVFPTEVYAQGHGKKDAPRDARELKANYERKLQREFMDKVDWHQQLKPAIDKAKSENLPVLMYFTRSDRPWPPTDELETKSLMEPWWVKASERFVPYINVQTGGLRMREEVYYETYFPKRPMIPLFALIDHRGALITHFRLVEPGDLERALAEAEELLEARRAAREEKTPLAKKRLKLIEGLRVEKPNFRALAKLAGTKDMDQHLVERFERMRAAAPVREILTKMGKAMRSAVESSGPEAAESVRTKFGGQMLRLYRKNIRITDRNEPDYRAYWELTFLGAVADGDRRVAMTAFETYEKTYANDPAFKEDIAEMRKKLNNMR